MLLAVLCGITAASAADQRSGLLQVVTGEKTSRPIGHVVFCQEHIDECGPNDSVTLAVSLTEELAAELASINTLINGSVRAVTDLRYYGVKEFWTYPGRAGDCEDFVLAKRRALAEAGWPLSTLLITLVKEPNGSGHAVLMVRTDHGDLVLDNLAPGVLLWNQTPYTYVKRQSQENAGVWVAIDDKRAVTIVASPS